MTQGPRTPEIPHRDAFLTQEIVALIMSPLICVIRKGHLREVTETDNNRKIPESQALMKNTFKYVLLILIVLGITRIASAQETRMKCPIHLGTNSGCDSSQR